MATSDEFDQWTYGAFPGAKVGWVVSGEGDVIKTTNGGTSWKRQSTGGMGVTDAFAVDASHAFISGATSAQPAWNFSTSDGGATWTRMSSTGIVYWTADGICAASPKVVWIGVNNGTVFKSVNGGQGWTLSHPGGDGGWVNGIDVGGGTTVCAVGANGNLSGTPGEAWLSRDGGTKWSLQHMAPSAESAPYGLNAVAFVSTTTGWVVGDHGQIFRTTNGGKSWTKQN